MPTAASSAANPSNRRSRDVVSSTCADRVVILRAIKAAADRIDRPHLRHVPHESMIRYAGSLSHRFLIARSYATFAQQAGEFLRSLDGPSEVLLIAPSKGAADDLARRCSSSGVLGLHRMTLNQLAASAATPRMVAEGKTPASRLGVEAIAARVVHLLRKEDRIPYFGP